MDKLTNFFTKCPVPEAVKNSFKKEQWASGEINPLVAAVLFDNEEQVKQIYQKEKATKKEACHCTDVLVVPRDSLKDMGFENEEEAVRELKRDTRFPSIKYAQQLKQLREMGFEDEDEMQQALEMTDGDIDQALAKLT